MTGTGFTIPPAKRSLGRSANSPIGKTLSVRRTARGAKTSHSAIRVLGAVEWLGRREVGQPELYPLLALPAIERKAAGNVHLPAAAVAQRDTELLASCSKSNGIHRCAIAGFQTHADVRLTHFFRVSDRVCRKRDDRLRIAGPERSSPRDHGEESPVGCGGGHRAVDQKAARPAYLLDIGRKRRLEISAQRRERSLAQGNARGHGVPAAFHQQPVSNRAPYRAANVDARDRTPRAGADAAGLKRNGKSRPAEFLLQTRGNE